jgi:hypothetical protein
MRRDRGFVSPAVAHPPGPVRPSEAADRAFQSSSFQRLTSFPSFVFSRNAIRAKLILESSKLRVIAGAGKISFSLFCGLRLQWGIAVLIC